MSNLTKYSEFSLEEAEEAESELKDLSTGKQFMKFGVGRTTIRILPGLPGEKALLLVQQHYVKLPGGKTVVFACPRAHAKKPCPACIRFDKLIGTGDPKDKDVAYEHFKPSLGVFCNAINRADVERGVQIAKFGKKVYEQLVALRKNEDAGGNFTDPTELGFDIVIERTGLTKNDTEYKVWPNRKQSPLASDATVANTWLQSMSSLKSYALVEEWDELVKRLTGGGGPGGGAPAAKSAPKAPSAADYAIDTDGSEVP